MTPKEALNNLFVLASEYHQKLWCIKLAPKYPEEREKYINRIINSLPNDGDTLNNLYKIIEQAIEVLEIIKVKQVDIEFIGLCVDEERYNRAFVPEDDDRKLTQDEFGKVRAWLKNV